MSGLRDWIGKESKLGNPALKAAVAATGDPDLALRSSGARRSIARSKRSSRRSLHFRLCANRLTA